MFTFEIFTVFFIGLIFGSFANVCIARLPKDKTVIFGRSNCPKCKNKISWFDNIPLISFILLKGKCRRCNKKISINYFFVELITGIFFITIFLYSSNYFDFVLINLILILFWIPKPEPIGAAKGIIATAPTSSNLFAIKGSSLQ